MKRVLLTSVALALVTTPLWASTIVYRGTAHPVTTEDLRVVTPSDDDLPELGSTEANDFIERCRDVLQDAREMLGELEKDDRANQPEEDDSEERTPYQTFVVIVEELETSLDDDGKPIDIGDLKRAASEALVAISSMTRTETTPSNG